jgi:hypothetical protein
MNFTFLLVLLLLLALTQLREGFDPYVYLYPHAITELDQTTEATFTTTFNKVNASYPKIVPLNQQSIKIYKASATLDEFKYYINNNKWPYGSYLTAYINKHAVLSDAFSPIIPTPVMIQKAFPSRFVYASIKSPSPADEIFMG